MLENAEKNTVIHSNASLHCIRPPGSGKMMRIRPDPDPQHYSKPMLGLAKNFEERAGRRSEKIAIGKKLL
jgi:hypothetical protein